jgi:nucleotide-binding universal stress UspA family protein
VDWRRAAIRRKTNLGVQMSTVMPSTGGLYLVVGYDGADPAVRALDTAAALLRGREGSIEVLYIAQLTSAEMLSADAIGEMDDTFDEIARDLHVQAAGQLRGREERWTFARGQGLVTDILIEAAGKTRDAHPEDNVAIVVGSSSQARHRLVGSAAVSLARRAPVPLLLVP